MDEFDLEECKKRLQCIYPEMYDVMKYEKDEKFDKWVEQIFLSLPRK